MSKYSIFIDCGAPSLYNKLSRNTKESHSHTMGTSFKERKYDDYSYTETTKYKQYRQDYIDFLLQHKKKLKVYSNLDVINNPRLTFKNQKIMEEAGLSPIPVFHLGNDIKWLKKYIDRYEYIALGGLVPNPTSILIPMLDHLFKDHILDKKGFPKVKVHGFACTSLPLIWRYPWYSVDSATSRKVANYGGILLPEHSTGKFKVLSISSRDVPITHRITKGVLLEIEHRAEKYETTLEVLSTNVTERVVWNHLVFLESIKKLPQYPWSIQTRKAKKSATEALNFYLAGSLSKKEIAYFWERLAELKIDEATKFRLNSFFYKGEAIRDIELNK